MEFGAVINGERVVRVVPSRTEPAGQVKVTFKRHGDDNGADAGGGSSSKAARVPHPLRTARIRTANYVPKTATPRHPKRDVSHYLRVDVDASRIPMEEEAAAAERKEEKATGACLACRSTAAFNPQKVKCTRCKGSMCEFCIAVVRTCRHFIRAPYCMECVSCGLCGPSTAAVDVMMRKRAFVQEVRICETPCCGQGIRAASADDYAWCYCYRCRRSLCTDHKYICKHDRPRCRDCPCDLCEKL